MNKSDRKSQLQYAQSMLRELRELTRDEEVLSYLIEMAYLEASDVVRALHAGQAAGDDAPVRRAA
jgi:hypothetical protein